MLNDLGLRITGWMAQYPIPMLQIPMKLHVSNRNKAIEPCVRNLLHRLREPMRLNPLF